MVGSVLGIFGEQVAKHGTATSSAKISVQQIRIFTITSSCASIQTENSAPATPVPKYDTHASQRSAENFYNRKTDITDGAAHRRTQLTRLLFARRGP